MAFIGHHEHTIDAKNRLAIPARFREQVEAERGRGFVAVPGEPQGTLWLYTDAEFNRLAGQLSSSLTPDDDQVIFDSGFFSLAEPLEMDSQGRVLIPEYMLQATGLSREIVICGARDHLEIKPRAEFKERLAESWNKFGEFRRMARGGSSQQGRQSGSAAGDNLTSG
jgi:MraZ protein